MWCSLCRADVSVRTTGHSGGLLCSRCGHDLLAATRPADAIRQAREILERWNSSDLFERISRTESLDSLSKIVETVKKPEPQKPLLSREELQAAAPKNSRITLTPAHGDQSPELQKSMSQASPEADLSIPPNRAEDNVPPVKEISELSDVSALVTVPEIDRQSNVSELTHVDVLNVTTVTSSPVTGEGITSELQKVMDLARAREAELKGSQIPEVYESEVSSCAAEAGEVHPDTASDTVQSAQSVPDAVTVSRADSELSSPEPAETANVVEFMSSAVPKKITRSPMRRPLLHRRFQRERPATISSTGSENVNRKLRVDQPGGNDDVAEIARKDGSVSSSVAPETKIVSNSVASGRRFRIDAAESVDRVTGTDGRRARTQSLPKYRYIDDAHDAGMRGPHFEITTPRRSNLTSVTGQFLAYMGVLGLTIGTAMVIYGHFGGYSEYTPTGWLVTTVAQMLLFLGVINLVSGGIEQNNDDVSRRINSLGEQLIRIEQVASDAMRGPKLPAHLYDNPDAEVEVDAREAAGIRRD